MPLSPLARRGTGGGGGAAGIDGAGPVLASYEGPWYAGVVELPPRAR